MAAAAEARAAEAEAVAAAAEGRAAAAEARSAGMEASFSQEQDEMLAQFSEVMSLLLVVYPTVYYTIY